MKKIILFFVLGFTAVLNAQDKITFNYDQAGNQIVRELCINCTSAKAVKKVTNEIAELEEGELQKFTTEDAFSYYPNPVKEELYLQWDSNGLDKVATIHVFDLNGRLLKSYSNLKNQKNQSIAFQNYAAGFYEVVLVFENNEKKAIKIIKK